ncbi:MAG: crossover junction endodeoxyribonuclease RuvC [Armatimonadetes bacterium CG_4_10_14_3_um_filter_66_18]|nr:crossover junction endodeoxyribonuclease RuvC [Armatimonadota bacterium]PIU90813.1 MAG: crossover junction endodeoxyribonuclease RuvC [Armatimonadetes bacterium CG06_land_8_20_14_3_00_66_21]PIX50139.1 MAG: crossover junction endodeoxyribonuclease RuvC [Armatimonadetes bacterium CG_4_8_14_3_um_filter_66_20]PIY45252.1 MAG: crossover junction endodeoxyribonuclease RuvC [Armatimonadetes bacterium CG_4_10_14_3_um_filter_66_18]PIZ45707.1 MAG: crossover junction endodeoxyribonuclease RuvC [Armatimo
MPSAVLRVAGIDPGLNATGYGILDFHARKIALVEAGVVRTSTKQPLAERLSLLHQELALVFQEFQPDAVSVEEVYSHYAHPRTAVLMAHARAVALLAAADRAIAVHSYGATLIKRAVSGSGKASKQLIQAAVKQRLGLTALPEPPDVADALAAALCHGQRVRGGV